MSDHSGIRRSFYELGNVDNVGLIRVVGDGNCIFRAISYCIHNRQEIYFGVVHKNIIEHVLKEWNRFSVAYVSLARPYDRVENP